MKTTIAAALIGSAMALGVPVAAQGMGLPVGTPVIEAHGWKHGFGGRRHHDRFFGHRDFHRERFFDRHRFRGDRFDDHRFHDHRFHDHRFRGDRFGGHHFHDHGFRHHRHGDHGFGAFFFVPGIRVIIH